MARTGQFREQGDPAEGARIVCHADVAVTGGGGGLVDRNYGAITNCYATGSIEGIVEVENLVSGTVQNVGADETASSNPDGTIDVEETEDGDIPEDPEDAGEEEEEGSTIHELRIRMVNEETNSEKFIIIEYAE